MGFFYGVGSEAGSGWCFRVSDAAQRHCRIAQKEEWWTCPGSPPGLSEGAHVGNCVECELWPSPLALVSVSGSGMEQPLELRGNWSSCYGLPFGVTSPWWKESPLAILEVTPDSGRLHPWTSSALQSASRFPQKEAFRGQSWPPAGAFLDCQRGGCCPALPGNQAAGARVKQGGTRKLGFELKFDLVYSGVLLGSRLTTELFLSQPLLYSPRVPF